MPSIEMMKTTCRIRLHPKQAVEHGKYSEINRLLASRRNAMVSNERYPKE